MNIILTSERINYILPSMDYISEYLTLINNPDIYQYVTDHHIDYTYEDEINWVNNNQDGTHFTLIDRVTGDFIGNMGFNSISGNTAEVGIILTPQYQNHGYGQEAVNTLINYAFNTLGLEELTAIVYSFNNRSLHCCESLGFEVYQVVENVCTHNNESVNDVYLRLRRN